MVKNLFLLLWLGKPLMCAVSSNPIRIYEINKRYRFSYELIINNDNYHCSLIGDGLNYGNDKKERNWSLVKSKILLDSVERRILYVGLIPREGAINNDQYPMEFNYFNTKKDQIGTLSMSGIYDDATRIWIHPPRDYYFQILEFSPYPYIKFPLAVNSKWKWGLEVGDNWSMKDIVEYQGNVNLEYHYKVIRKELLNTDLGKLECYVVEANGISILGKSKLISYFNEKYGFVKLVYHNIDKSCLTLKLEDIK
jgi:hypothetical protein